MIINASILNALRVSFTSLHNAAFASADPQWKKVAMEVNSTGKEEKYGWLGNFAKFREWIGDRQYQNLKEFDYTIKNRTFENTITVPREAIEDDSIGIYSPLAQQLGNDAAMHPDELVFGLLPLAFNTPCYDGQYFIDTDHPVTDATGAVQSVSNFGGGAGNPWFLMDCRGPIKPLIFQKRRAYKFVSLQDETNEEVFKRNQFIYGVDARVASGFGLWQLIYGSKQTLDKTNFDSAYAAMQSVYGDGGKPLGVRPNLLVCGPSNRSKALEIAKMARLANGQDNPNVGLVEVLVVPWLP
ncbi:MAG: hypothetical protein DI551_08235 [Micavibrio aeruginosavorus]|uniref:Bacteriophage Mu GpT domain-containing protein n=1 Tax=Micavibrio aeruginosavorus TaxID=349221 RepID=A0A2W5MVF8_9BACT|nr:MAG: hypothetical protein DI551_08235 [Micavibrio aeruginosavorus]